MINETEKRQTMQYNISLANILVLNIQELKKIIAIGVIFLTTAVYVSDRYLTTAYAIFEFNATNKSLKNKFNLLPGGI